jgi:HSP20 family molecular chaperone IbpA
MKPITYKPTLADSFLSSFLESPFTDIAPLIAQGSLLTGDTVRFNSTLEQFTVEVDLPGAKREDTNVEITGNRVFITAKRRVTTQSGIKDETLNRSFSLDKDADLDTIQATQENGVLIITVQRKNSDKYKTKTIEIR